MLTIVELFYDFVISTLVGLFGLHLITKKGILASKLLGLYFLIFCYRIIIAYFVTDGRLVQYPEFIHAYSPFHFLAPVISFLFVYFMLYPQRRMAWWHGLLFLPFVLHLIELLPFFLGPLENKVKEVGLIMKYRSLIKYPSDVSYFSPATLATLKVSNTFLWALVSFVLVLHFIRKNSYKRSFVLNWMLAYTSLSLLSVVFIIAYVMGIIGFNNLQFSYADLLMYLAAFLNVAIVLYRPALLDVSIFQSLVIRLQDDDRKAEAHEDTEKLKKYEGFAQLLEDYFRQQKPFLKESVSLDSTAKIVGISARELSRTIQYIYELNYPDFVNSWRINYILLQLKENEIWRSMSQDLIAEHSGFGSRQGLHNAVNKLHGVTPAQLFNKKA